MAVSFKHPSSDPKLAVPVSTRHFSGGGKTGDLNAASLTNIVRGLAMDHARQRVENAGVADVTDSSAGTAASDSVALVIPTAAFNAVSVNGAQNTDFITTMDEFLDAMTAFGDHLNNVRARLGLKRVPLLTRTFTAGTVPACDNAITAATGATTVGFSTGYTALVIIQNGYATLLRALNEVAAAIGEPILTENSGGTPDLSAYTIADFVNPTASATGSDSIDKTVADAFCAALRNNIATMCAKFNALMQSAPPTDLTNSAGGTASNTLAAVAVPPITVSGGAGTCAPVAGFDGEIPKWRNNLKEFSTALNVLLARYNLTTITDNAAGTADATVEAVLAALTGVDGGTLCVDGAKAAVVLATLKNALSTVAANVNALSGYFGAIPLTDNTGGTVSTTNTLAAMALTTPGNDGTANTMLDSTGTDPMDTQLAVIRNSFTSIAAKIKEFQGTDAGEGLFTKPLHVVAGL